MSERDTAEMFRLVRDEDESGVSGTGHVAGSVIWHDGTCTVHWRTQHTSTTVYKDFATMLAIHGHGDETRVEFVEHPYDRGVSEAAQDAGGDGCGAGQREGRDGAVRISCPHCHADEGRCPEVLPACRARGDETRRLIARANGYPDTPGEAQQRVIEEAVVRALAPVLRERDAAERRCEALRADLAAARDLADIADAVRASQIDELRAIIAGSPDAPTDAELDAHAGPWLARIYNGALVTMSRTAARDARGVWVGARPYATRWWPLGRDEWICARRPVTEVPATLTAGPRDGDGCEVTP